MTGTIHNLAYSICLRINPRVILVLLLAIPLIVKMVIMATTHGL